MEEQVKRKVQVEMNKNLSTSSMCEVIGSFIGLGNGCEVPAPPVHGGFLFWNWTHASCLECEQSGRTYKLKISLLSIKWQKKIKHNKNHNKCNKNNNKNHNE